MNGIRVLVLLGCLSGVPACSGGSSYIKGTQVSDTSDNRAILGVVEKYRLAVERRDAQSLVGMASKNYWEDGGTPGPEDDYGYEGLQEVLAGRLQRADDVRYTMKYLKVRRQGNRAFVQVMVDASYTVKTATGEERKDHRDQNELVLEWDGDRWLFLSGM
jgi:hypothetical protein